MELQPQKFFENLGRYIDKLRKQKRLSFQELTLPSEIEKSNLVKLTSQGTNLTVVSLHKIAKGLDVYVHELLKF
jgi:DNA-binding Xre family transcriptional regulator